MFTIRSTSLSAVTTTAQAGVSLHLYIYIYLYTEYYYSTLYSPLIVYKETRGLSSRTVVCTSVRVVTVYLFIIVIARIYIPVSHAIFIRGTINLVTILPPKR